MQIINTVLLPQNRLMSRIVATIALITVLVSGAKSFSTAHAQDVQSSQGDQAAVTKQTIYLPLVVSVQPEATPRDPVPAPTLVPTLVPTPTPTPVILSPEEAEVEKYLRAQSGQQHPTLKLNSILVEQARRKAKDMAERVYFDHVDPDGFGPDYWVLKAGYQLPDYYGTDPKANYIESIGAGYADAASVWNAWMLSQGHRAHLLGENQFYRNQIEFGIGYYYKANGSYSHYWVVLIAEPKK